MSIQTNSRIAMIEDLLRVTLPRDYAKFIVELGRYDGEYYEVFGYDENIKDIQAYPCVIGMTLSYAKDNPLMQSQDIMIHFDEYLNSIVALDCIDGAVYNIDFNERKQISPNFELWFQNLKNLEQKIDEE